MSENFVCICKKSYATREKLKQHQRYYCRPNFTDSNTCEFCNRDFNSYPGLRQHIKKAHPYEYNNELETNTPSKNDNFSALESLHMVEEEIGYDGRYVNKHLASIFEHRTVEEIKNHRRTTAYKSLYEKIRLEREEADKSSTMEEGTTSELSTMNLIISPGNEMVENNLTRISQPKAKTTDTSHNKNTNTRTPNATINQSVTLHNIQSPKQTQMTRVSQTSNVKLNTLAQSPKTTNIQNLSSSRIVDSEILSNTCINTNTNRAQKSGNILSTANNSSENTKKMTRIPQASVSNLSFIENNNISSTLTQTSTSQIYNNNNISKTHITNTDTKETLTTYIKSLVYSEQQSLDNDLVLKAIDDYNAATMYINNELDKITTSQSRGSKKPSSQDPNTKRQKYRKHAKRAYEFKQAQQLYKSDRTSLAHHILENIPFLNSEITPAKTDIEEEFKNIFSTESIDDPSPILRKKQHNIELCAPVKVEDIDRVLTKRSSDSPGPDNIRTTGLREYTPLKLAVLYNLMLIHGIFPTRLRTSRTTLIPKGNSDLRQVNNWRPITISSLIIRILHKILAERFKQLPFNQSQRGFLPIDGTLANNMSLQVIVRHCRRELRPHSITSLDLRKAFDSVSHHSIRRALTRFDVDNHLITFIMEGYTNCSTTIRCGSIQTDTIKVNRGVKQGDPLSPYLFNMVLDELLEQLNELPAGLSIGNESHITLAYADDILLFGSTATESQFLIRLCQRFFEKRQMLLNAEKCVNLTSKLVPHKKKLFISTTATLYAGDGLIKQIGVGDFFKYLGQKYSSTGVDIPNLSQLPIHLDRITRAPLKPQQKLIIIKYHLIPRYLSLLQNTSLNKKTLLSADRLIRLSVKKTLHLPKSCSNAFLYASLRNGGLGLLSLYTRVPDILLGRIQRILDLQDDKLKSLLNDDFCTHFCGRLEHLNSTIGRGRRVAEIYWARKLEASVSGNGLYQVGHLRAASSWIDSPPPYWNGGDYISAVLLRGNLLPTTGGVHNAAPFRRCRAGCNRTESLSHVLQSCPVTHTERIKRHDHVVHLVGKAAQRAGWDVEFEPRFRNADGVLRKPDLLATKGNEVIIAEVGINWEGPENLNKPFRGKLSYYSEPGLIESFKNRFPNQNITIRPFIVGARGGWCPQNKAIKDNFKLSENDLRTIIADVLKGGWLTHKSFSKFVWE